MIRLSSRRVVGFALALCSLAAAALFVLPAAAMAEGCPNEQLRAEAHSTTLPDCRAYELVTPPFKEAARFEFEKISFGPGGLVAMSANGLHVDGFSVGDFGDAQSNFNAGEYELSRTEYGWTEQSIDLPESQFPASHAIATTPELGAVLYEARAADQSINAKDFWLREADGALRDIGPFEPPADTAGPPGDGVGKIGPTGGSGGTFWFASSDLSHILFESPVAWPGDEGYGPLYEYTVGQSGPPVPVGVEPNGSPCPSASLPFPIYRDQSAISANGSTVFFTCSGEILARIEESRTVGVSEPSTVDCSACDTSPGVLAAASFDVASADGSKVFFTTTQPLLGSETETSANIYEYDFDAPAASPGDPDGRIVHVTAGRWGAQGAQVQDVVKVSQDGSHVYFVAAGALQGASNDRGQLPEEGEPNLYVFDTETGATAFIATASPNDPSVTPDGQFLVFTSSADLTPGDTSTAQQVFEYNAQTGELVRVSIGQNGFNDNGNTDAFSAEVPPIGGEGEEYQKPSAVSDNGAYVVFQSADGLTPGALNGDLREYEFTDPEGHYNGTYYANNVYEYHDGNVYLISDGQDASYSAYALGGLRSSVRVKGLSPSGDDVFFETADQLVSQDVDTEIDLYDTRIDGGFPAPVSLLPTCSGDACQGPLSAAPVLLSPGSEFQAGGNPPLSSPEPASMMKAKAKPKLAKCRKGDVRKKNSCVKRPKAKKSAKGRK